MLQPVQSFYIHWPFCPYRCHFCPFVALASHDEYMGRYHAALVQEIKLFCAQLDYKPVLKTLFFGGGTPSTYPPELLLDTFGILKSNVILSRDVEITLEVNPGTVTEEKLRTWQEVGINRLSIGVQGLKDAVLKSLNRHQSARDVYALLEQASGRFASLSVDLILGLPGVSEYEWKELIKEVVTWPIQHVSVYFLTVHEETPLYFGVRSERIVLHGDESMVNTYGWTVEYLEQHGFLQYEISNFARAGYASRHNTVYWERLPYKGFGLGACSFDGSERSQNEKNLMNYCVALESQKIPEVFRECLTPEQVRLERIMLDIRQRKGLSFETLFEGIFPDQRLVLERRIQELLDGFLIEIKERALVLTPAGRAVENEVIVKLVTIE